VAVTLPRLADRVLARIPSAARSAVGEQTVVTAAQVLAGAGNLAFTIAAARILDPAGFARLAAFLAVYLLVHLPTGSLSAAGALDPRRVPRLRRRIGPPALAGGAAVAAAAPVLAPALGLSPALVVTLGAAVPGAVLLSLERGPLHALGMHRRIGLSLLAEPLVRLAAGIPLTLVAGPEGAAVGITAAGYAAWAVAARRRPAASPTVPPAPVPAGRVGWTMTSFVLLAVLFQQDLLLANSRLPAGEAGAFAAVSTLGGITAFATVRIPTMLLPRALQRSREALATAYLSTAAIAVTVAAAAALVPDLVVGAVFGDAYGAAVPLVPRYLAAMGLLALLRVWVTYSCASGHGTTGTAVAAGTLAVHLGLLLAVGTDAAGVADATLWAATAGVGGVALLEGGNRLRRRRGPATAAVTGLTALALAVRLPVTRGLWLDEATSVAQARLPFGAMIGNLAATDVHPPLHAAVLWATTRVAGFSELAVRAPSLVAGALTIPALYVCGRDLYGRRTGLVAATLGTVGPFLVWYSQEARMYAFFMLFALLALWAQVRIRNGRTGAADWALWVVFSALLAYTQYFGLLQILVQAGVFLADLRPGAVVDGRRVLVRSTLTAFAVLLLLLGPLVPFAFGQMTANEARHAATQIPAQEGGAVAAAGDLDVYAVVANGIWALFGYHADETMAQIGALWPLGMLAALALLGRGRSGATTFLLAVAGLPAAALLVLGTRSRFLFEVRYFAGAVPILFLLTARTLTVAARGRRALLATTGAAVVVLSLATADEQLNRENPRIYDFREALAFVEQQAAPGDVLVYQPAHLDTVIDYYAPSVSSRPLDEGLPAGAGRVFVLGSFFDNPRNADRTSAALSALDDDRSEQPGIHHGQVRVWVFR